MLIKNFNHKILIPFSALIGANLLLLSDILSQLPTLNQNLPINSITSLIGIPFIIWIITKKKRITNVN